MTNDSNIPDNIRRLLASMPEARGPQLDYETRAAIATFAVARRQLAALLGNKSLIGTIGELYVAVGLEGRMSTNCETGFDIELPNAQRIQVKSCAAEQGQFGGFTAKSIDGNQFDIAAFVLLDDDLLPTGAATVPRHAIPDIAKRKGHVCLFRNVIRHPEATDVFAAVSEGALGLRSDQEPDWDRLDEDH